MGNFTFTETGLKDCFIVEPKVFGDDRGFFMETYNKQAFIEAGYIMEFVQDNHSKSKKGVLRGLHFQKTKPQGKLVRVVSGEVFDVAVDLRKDSETFGKWFGLYLNAENKKQLYVPEGFAHGFLVTSDYAEFCYKCTALYDPTDEGGVMWNDKSIGVEWPLDRVEEVLLSDKDRQHGGLINE